MPNTPEGWEKNEVRKYLDSIGAYQFWPVQIGYGKRTLDCLACIDGVFWGIETKRQGEEPTKLQERTMQNIIDAKGGAVWGTADIILPHLIAWRKHRL